MAIVYRINQYYTLLKYVVIRNQFLTTDVFEDRDSNPNTKRILRLVVLYNYSIAYSIVSNTSSLGT